LGVEPRLNLVAAERLDPLGDVELRGDTLLDVAGDRAWSADDVGPRAHRAVGQLWISVHSRDAAIEAARVGLRGLAAEPRTPNPEFAVGERRRGLVPAGWIDRPAVPAVGVAADHRLDLGPVVVELGIPLR